MGGAGELSKALCPPSKNHSSGAELVCNVETVGGTESLLAVNGLVSTATEMSVSWMVASSNARTLHL